MVRVAEWDEGKTTENETLDNEAWAAAVQGRIQFAHEAFRFGDRNVSEGAV
jgi:hypothetical protein